MRNTILAFLTGIFVLMFSMSGTLVQAQHITVSSYSGQSEIKAPLSVTLTDGFHTTGPVRIYTTGVNCNDLLSSPSTNFNYLLTRVFKKPGVSDLNLADLRGICEENQDIQYFDSHGRPIQAVQIMASPSFSDIIQPIVYDAFGREVVKYQYYTETSNGGAYRLGAITAQQSFYSSQLSTSSIKQTTSPYSVTIFEPSPLNRVLEQGFPGASWQPVPNNTTGHTVKIEYGINQMNNTYADVRLWNLNANGNGATSMVYPEGKLYKSTSKDENWKEADGRTGTTDEFKDLEDKVVLKRVWETDNKNLDTYYIYDDFGNLRYVLPPAVNINTDKLPAAITSFNETDATFKDFIYGYHYDEKNRLIEKKVPGKDWEYTVYNKLDKVVLTQDANQRALNQWQYTKYDMVARVVSTGLYTDNVNTSRSSLQGLLDGQVNLWETRSGAEYDGISFPQSGTDPLVISYYDNYDFTGNTFGQPTSLQATGLHVKGLLTGIRTKVLGTTSFLLSVNYYDLQGRVVQTKSVNHLDGTDVIDNIYSFVGEIIEAKRTHTAAPNGTPTVIINHYEYDHMGRKLITKEEINGQGEVVLAKVDYNELGQPKLKSLHSVNGSPFIQEIAYKYNERGWLTGINDPLAVTGTRVFGMELNYANKPDAYNGNIGSISWQTKVPSGLGLNQHLQNYTYEYDALKRLKKADYSNANLSAKFNEELVYDVMGNISSLKRTNSASGYLNDLGYSYTGNKLDAVTDGGVASQSSSYSYDANGNQKTNSRIGITNIDYNILNLPRLITKSSTGETLVFTYDAMGNKLRKQFGSQVTDYVGGIQYSNGAIDFIATEEGRMVPGTSYSYEYFLKDHLGNIRATVKQNGDIVQVQDYYAFGLEMNPGNALSPSPANQYKYNGKEKQIEMGLGQYDYGARFYDPVVGRWSVVDPLAEKGRKWSPYNYTFNNPIKFTDPDGMWPDPIDPLLGYRIYLYLEYKIKNVFGLRTYAEGMRDIVVNDVRKQEYEETTPIPQKFIDINYKIQNLAGNNKAASGMLEFYGTAHDFMGMAMGGVQDGFAASFERNIAYRAKDKATDELLTYALPLPLKKEKKGVFIVTKDGVVLPKGAEIPSEFVENPFRSGNYGVYVNGKYVEKVRIDPPTPINSKGPNISHFHLDNGKDHITDASKWPWWGSGYIKQ